MVTMQRSTSGSHSLRIFLSVLLAIAVGALLQFAAVAKAISPSADPDKAVTLFGLFDDPVSIDVVIAAGEFMVVLLVLALCRWSITWVAVALMFAGFAGYSAFSAFNGVACGCFGKLWTPPAAITTSIDIALALAAIGMAAWWGVRTKAIAGVAIAAVLFMGLGFAYAQETRDPSAEQLAEQYEGKDAAQRLKEAFAAPDANADEDAPAPATPSPDQAESPSNQDNATSDQSSPIDDTTGTLGGSMRARLTRVPELAEAFAAGPTEPASYIFIYDPSCATCEQMKLMCVDQDEEFLEEIARDPFLRVIQLNKYDLEEATGIESYAWPGSPTVLLVYDGEIINTWWGEHGVPCPGTSATIGDSFREDDGVYPHIVAGDWDALRAPTPHTED